MKSSIRAQLFIQVSLIILVCVVLMLFANSQLLPYFYKYSEEKSLKNAAADASRLDSTQDTYYKQLSEIEQKYDVNLELYSQENKVLYPNLTTFPSNVQTLNEIIDYFSTYQRNVIVIEQKEKKNGVFQTQQDRNSGTQYLAYLTVLSDGNYLEVFNRISAIETNASIASELIWRVATIVMLLACVMVYFYSRKITNPLIEMSGITRRMAKMDFSRKCKVKSKDELGELGASINSLSDSLDKTLQDLKTKNARLKNDIEWERQQEQVRKEFISNVSHELKTPIAIIQGYAEGLELGVADNPDTVREYCKVIMDETVRMNDMVVELLELSKYEQGAYALHCVQFSVRQFVDGLLASTKILLEEKGIQMENLIDPAITAWGDPSKLEMVLNNYIGNAISHIKPPYILRVSSQETEDAYRICVFNTGKQIAPEDIEKIWNSFYRADKSHNRSENRYGLGLSIVRAIQNLHHMKYGVENLPDGVSFWFDIAKKQPAKTEEEKDV